MSRDSTVDQHVLAPLEIVVVAPQIPTNTGAIIRLCANIGAPLHLVEPIGFSLDDRSLKRGGLDYHELATVTVHSSWAACRAAVGADRGWWGLTARAADRYDSVPVETGDVFVFGCESDGLPPDVLDDLSGRHLSIPMVSGSRSINLANAVAVVAVDRWMRLGFPGAAASDGSVGATASESVGRHAGTAATVRE